MTVVAGLSIAFPSIDDLWVDNPFWNGLSEFYSYTKPARLASLEDLRDTVRASGNSTLLMLGPSRMFSSSDVQQVKAYLEAGGKVVLADDFGAGNDLLEGLELEARFSGVLMMDALFKDHSRVMPQALNVAVEGKTLTLTMNYPTVLINTESAKVLAWSSYFSYLGMEDGAPSDASPGGPFPIVARMGYKEGSLILISDSSLFINSMLEKTDNRDFLRSLVVGQVLIDESHSIPSRLTLAKGLILTAYSFVNLPEVKYGLAAVALILIFKVQKGRDEKSREDDLESVIREHPEYDREILFLLKEERGGLFDG